MLNKNSLANQKIALTGGTGFLGGHLLNLFRQKGVKARCLARPRSQAPEDMEIIRGDCLDYASIKSLLEGQDIFIHMAALLFGSDWREYLRANSAIIRHINRAMAELGPEGRPKKIILVSSLAAAGPCAKAPGKREAEAPAPVSAYGWSKLYCEEAIAAAPAETLTILRPPIIYGSGDKGLLPLFRSLKKGLGASPGAFREFPVSIIHARDAAGAILMACEKNIPGTFHLSDGKVYNMASFCHAAATAMGKSTCLVLHAPLPVMGLSAKLAQAAHKIRRKFFRQPLAAPHWNEDKFLEASQEGWLADSSLFEQKTGFVPQMDLASGMTETVQGYTARGWL